MRLCNLNDPVIVDEKIERIVTDERRTTSDPQNPHGHVACGRGYRKAYSTIKVHQFDHLFWSLM